MRQVINPPVYQNQPQFFPPNVVQNVPPAALQGNYVLPTKVI